MIGVCIAAGLYGGFLYLLRQRRLPVLVMRVWFCFWVGIAVVLSWAMTQIVLLLEKKAKLFSQQTSESIVRLICVFNFGVILQLNSGHIHVKWMAESLAWSDITEQHNLCLCHTSFFDTMVYLWLVPLKYIYSAKTFAKASLRKLPLFGRVVSGCGHFPVYFADENSASFSVNKEKQAAVAAEVVQFLDEGGSLSFFPEGALNRTPEVLKDFRLGSFNTIVQRKLPLYYMVTYGNHEVWYPSLQGLPGYPADVYVYIGKYDYDPSTVDARALATGLREEMQRHLNDMLKLRKQRDYTPWYSIPPKPLHVDPTPAATS